jgi:uncharacterized protein YkwD
MMQMTSRKNPGLRRNDAGRAIRVRDGMLRFALILSTTLFTPLPGVAAGAAGAGTPTAMTPPPSATVAEQYLLNEANRSRAAHGLAPLRHDATLAQAARFHAVQMAEHADISHQFPGEPDLMQRGSQAGVRFSLITENVAESPDSSIIHDLWMRSAGHRENLLDPEVDSIGIAVVSRGNRVYAVEDFASTVESLSYEEQEQTVASVLARTGITVGSSNVTSTTEDARRTCSQESGYAGAQNKPWYIVRYTADHLDQLPGILSKRISTGRFRKAVVGACQDGGAGAFSDYNIAVLLYP